MSSTSFSPDILLSPFISLDQTILSLVYSSDVVQMGQDFSFFLVPENAVLYPSSVLWWLYAYFLQNSQISRIVYIWQDDIQKPLVPQDKSIDYVLWKSLIYDQDYYKNFDFLDFQTQSLFYTNSILRSTHVFYARFLENISICPLVLPKNTIKNKKNYSWLMSYLQMVSDDPATVCVFFDSYSFSIDEQSQVSINKGNPYALSTMFYDHCIRKQKHLHLLQSEFIETLEEENPQDIYQWIFSF